MADACKSDNEHSGSVKYREFLTSCGPVSFAGKNLLHGVCVCTYFGSFRFPLLLPVCLHLISNPQFPLSTVTSYVNLQPSVPQNVRATNSLHIYNTGKTQRHCECGLYCSCLPFVTAAGQASTQPDSTAFCSGQ